MKRAESTNNASGPGAARRWWRFKSSCQQLIHISSLRIIGILLSAVSLSYDYIGSMTPFSHDPGPERRAPLSIPYLVFVQVPVACITALIEYSAPQRGHCVIDACQAKNPNFTTRQPAQSSSLMEVPFPDDRRGVNSNGRSTSAMRTKPYRLAGHYFLDGVASYNPG